MVFNKDHCTDSNSFPVAGFTDDGSCYMLCCSYKKKLCTSKYLGFAKSR